MATLKPTKILELKGSTWMKGLALQQQMPIGGLFKVTTGFDPFELAGYLKGTLAPTFMTDTPIDSGTIITNVNIGGVAYVLVHTPTKLYKYLRNSPYTQTDITSSINVSSPVGGAIMWKGYYVYAQAGGDIYSWDLASTNTKILQSDALDIKKLLIAPDGNLYVNCAGTIGKLINVTGTSGNSNGVFSIDAGYTPRDMCTDGTYLIVVADNNAPTTTSRVTGTYNCKAYFWDMDTTRTTSNRIWEIQDSYLIGCQYQVGIVYVWGANGLYVCNYTTAPKMILDVSSTNTTVTQWPVNPYQITQSSNAIYWAGGTTDDGAGSGQKIMAYGSFPGQKNKIFYSPYYSTISGIKHTAIQYSSGSLWCCLSPSNAFTRVYVHNLGTTRNDANVTTTPIVFDQPYTFLYMKVTLRQTLTTGQGVQLGLENAQGADICQSTTQSYSALNPRKNLIFRRSIGGTGKPMFEDCILLATAIAGAEVERISVYATPVEDAETSL